MPKSVAQHPLRLAPLPDEEWDDRARAAVTALLPPSAPTRATPAMSWRRWCATRT